jgi:transcriptional regulator with XRE-family HTH domain
MSAKINLSELRESLGLTQRQVAVELDTTEKTIWRSETNPNSLRITTLQKIAEFYSVAVDDIIDKES